MYKTLSDQEADRDGDMEDNLLKRKALANKARECLYDTMDRLEGDKSHVSYLLFIVKLGFFKWWKTPI